MDDYTEILSKSALFLSIKKEDIGSLLKCLQSQTLRFSKGEYIWNAGEQISQIGVLVSGSVQIIRDNIMGVRTILAEIGVGELFGEVFAYDGDVVLPISVLATEDCRVIFLNSKNIIHACHHMCDFHQQIIENILRIIVKKSLYLNQKNEILSSRNTQEKILTYFSILATKTGSPTFTVPFDRQGLADYLAVNRSALSTELGKLKEAGVLRFEKNCFTLLMDENG